MPEASAYRAMKINEVFDYQICESVPYYKLAMIVPRLKAHPDERGGLVSDAKALSPSDLSKRLKELGGATVEDRFAPRAVECEKCGKYKFPKEYLCTCE